MLKRKQPQERTVFSNYYDTDRYDAIRQFLVNERHEIPTEEQGWDQLYFEEEINWDEAQREIKSFLQNIPTPLLLMGSIGRWDGSCAGGFIFSTLDELRKAWDGEDYIHIYDENGHLYINTSNHDGNSSYEIRILTEKGCDYLDRWECAWDDKRTEQEVHTRLFTDSHYSVLPHFAHKVYGCKKREYKTEV